MLSVIRFAFILLILAQAVSCSCAVAQSPMVIDGASGMALHPDVAGHDRGGQASSDATPISAVPLQPELIESATLFHEPAWLASTGSADSCDGCCDPSFGCQSCHGSIASHWTPWQRLHVVPNIDWKRLGIGSRFRAARSRDRGIGYERVMFAPNVLDTAIATPHVGFRYQLDYGLKAPDRAEYFWSKSPSGPAGNQAVNTQDLSVRLAIGNDKAMALTQYTLRSLDPDVAGNTTGMGDMVVGAQALLLDGKRTKLATLFRTYIATGSAQRGLGTGHTSLEHGLLARYCWSPETYLFGECKYWIPINGTSGTSGDVLSTGWGISSIASESDVYAFMPTLEVRTLTFLFGGQSTPNGMQSIDGLTAVELYPGARFVLGPGSDTGLCEFGCAAGVTLADDRWFDTRWVFDVRFSH